MKNNPGGKWLARSMNGNCEFHFKFLSSIIENPSSLNLFFSALVPENSPPVNLTDTAETIVDMRARQLNTKVLVVVDDI